MNEIFGEPNRPAHHNGSSSKTKKSRKKTNSLTIKDGCNFLKNCVHIKNCVFSLEHRKKEVLMQSVGEWRRLVVCIRLRPSPPQWPLPSHTTPPLHQHCNTLLKFLLHRTCNEHQIDMRKIRDKSFCCVCGFYALHSAGQSIVLVGGGASLSSRLRIKD